MFRVHFDISVHTLLISVNNEWGQYLAFCSNLHNASKNQRTFQFNVARDAVSKILKRRQFARLLFIWQIKTRCQASVLTTLA